MNHRTLRALAIGITLGSLALAVSGCSMFGPKPGLLSLDISASCAVQFEDGKQYAKISGNFRRSPDGTCEGKFEAVGVEAFAGQAIGAQTQQQQMQVIQALVGAVLAKLPSLPMPLPPIL